jgi:hypothetical protein
MALITTAHKKWSLIKMIGPFLAFPLYWQLHTIASL